MSIKVLFYTACTSDAEAIECALLAKRSVNATLGDVDFAIVLGEGCAPQRQIDLKVIYCPMVHNHWIGNLRYHRSIFDMDYDAFVYMDSDILWFAKDLDFSSNMYCREDVDISNPYFCTGWGIATPKATKGVNSGFFCVDKGVGVALSDFFFKHISKFKNSSAIENGKIEQSTFNLFLHKNLYKNWKEINDIFVFKSNKETKFEKNKNFHFNHYQSQMKKKIEIMNQFLINNNITI